MRLRNDDLSPLVGTDWYRRRVLARAVRSYGRELLIMTAPIGVLLATWWLFLR